MRNTKIRMALVSLAAVVTLACGWRAGHGQAGPPSDVIPVVEARHVHAETSKVPIGEVSLNDGVHSRIRLDRGHAGEPGQLVVAGDFLLRSEQRDPKRLVIRVEVKDPDGLDVFTDELEPFVPQLGREIPFAKVYGPLPVGSYAVQVHVIDEGGRLARFVEDGKVTMYGHCGAAVLAEVR